MKTETKLDYRMLNDELGNLLKGSAMTDLKKGMPIIEVARKYQTGAQTILNWKKSNSTVRGHRGRPRKVAA